MLQNHLNKKLFSPECEQVPIRKGLGEGLVIAGEKDASIVALCADLTESTQMHLFKKKFPERFVEMGVAEQNLASVASGMSAMGKLPVISSYAMFSPGRNWEQIRTTICYNDRKVVIAGSHAGVSVGPDGGTHQALEDIALMRVLPNMIVISPCDAIEAKKATLAALSSEVSSPVYIRLARETTPVITTEDSHFKIGKAEVLFTAEKPEVAIFATGALVSKALLVAENLRQNGRQVSVINVHTIKPLDIKTVVEEAKRAGAVVTVEEHQKAGGLGSAIAECLAENHPMPIEFVGVSNLFGQSGTPEELIEYYNLGEKAILRAITKVLGRK